MNHQTLYLQVMHEIHTEGWHCAKTSVLLCAAGSAFPGTTNRQLNRCRRAIEKARRKDNRRATSMRRQYKINRNSRVWF